MENKYICHRALSFSLSHLPLLLLTYPSGSSSAMGARTVGLAVTEVWSRDVRLTAEQKITNKIPFCDNNELEYIERRNTFSNPKLMLLAA